jgi:hypothetical protein
MNSENLKKPFYEPRLRIFYFQLPVFSRHGRAICAVGKKRTARNSEEGRKVSATLSNLSPADVQAIVAAIRKTQRPRTGSSKGWLKRLASPTRKRPEQPNQNRNRP